MKLPGTNSTKRLTTVDGKPCPIYNMWTNMRKRCYNSKSLERDPTYIGCSVCEDWLEFANFRAWVIDQQNWEGKHLDKDIITPKNKVYCPEECVFVPQQLNKLLTDHGAARGKYPIGVSKAGKKFKARTRINGDNEHIGHYDTPNEAHRAYVERKIEYIQTFIDQETDPRIVAGLRKHQQLIGADHAPLANRPSKTVEGAYVSGPSDDDRPRLPQTNS